jgi:hypothetical protein
MNKDGTFAIMEVHILFPIINWISFYCHYEQKIIATRVV